MSQCVVLGIFQGGIIDFHHTVKTCINIMFAIIKTVSKNIAELFSEKYHELYNYVSYEIAQTATTCMSNDNKSDITMVWYCMVIIYLT